MSSSTARRARRPLAVYLTLEAALSLFIAIYGTMTAVYRVEAAHLNPLQLTLVGTALEGSCFVFQLPTGALADTFSRRISVIIGVFLTGAGFLLEGIFPLFWTIVLASVLWGAGYCFISGAQEAWISDEIVRRHNGRILIRTSQNPHRHGTAISLFLPYDSTPLPGDSLCA